MEWWDRGVLARSSAGSAKRRLGGSVVGRVVWNMQQTMQSDDLPHDGTAAPPRVAASGSETGQEAQANSLISHSR